MVLDFLQRHKWLRLSICFVVALVLFCFPIVRSVVTAHALTLTAGGIIAVVSTFLLFTGITFASEAERDRVSLSFYNKSSSAFKEWVNNSVIQFPGTPPSGGNDKDPKDSGLLGTILSIPTAVLTVGITAAAAMFTAKKGETGKIEDTSGLNVPPWQKNIGRTLGDLHYDLYGYGVPPMSVWVPITVTLNQYPAKSPDFGTPITSIYPDSVLNGKSENYPYGIESVNTSQVMRVKGVSGVTYDYSIFVVKTASGLIAYLAENGECVGRLMIPFTGTLINFTIGLWGDDRLGQFSGSDKIAFRLMGSATYSSGEIVHTTNQLESRILGIERADYEMNDTKGFGHHISQSCTFQGVVDGRTGVVASSESYYNPSTLSSRLDQIEKALVEAKQANQPIEIKVPETAPELVNSPWQDVVNAQDKYIEALERRIAALEQGLDPEPTAPPEPPDSGGGDIGNAGDLKLPDLKLPADVTKVFPFCIPFDVVRAFDVFTAEPVPPRFVIPFKVGEVVNEEIVLDFSQFDFIIEIIRWGELLIFTVGLAVATRNYIKW